jgi:hypothetical protein
MKCPICRSSHVKKSKSGNAPLFFPLPLFVVSVRCHNCGWRFYRFGLFPGRKILAVSTQRRAAA